MNKTISIWHRRVPAEWIEEAKEIGSPCEPVTPSTLQFGPVIIAHSSVAEHTDHQIDRWSLLWVVRNDHNSYVVSKGTPAQKSQPIGTVILLDIHHPHRLVGPMHATGLWVALDFGPWNERPTIKRCKEMIKEMVQ